MDVQQLFTKQRIIKSLSLKPNFINTKIDSSIVNILNRTVGGRCCSEGYIKKNSIKIEDKSLGKINLGNSTGMVNYSVRFVCDICCPVEGNIYSCIVENKNKMGIVAYSQENNSKPLYILIPRDYIDDEFSIDSIEESDVLHVKVVGVRFKHNDSIIQVVGEIVGKE